MQGSFPVTNGGKVSKGSNTKDAILEEKNQHKRGSCKTMRSFWVYEDGWEQRPRPKTRESYRQLGHRTIASAGGGTHPETYHPNSSFCSTTDRNAGTSSFLYWSNGTEMTPTSTTYYLPPSFAPRPSRAIMPDRYFGVSQRFLPGQSFIPTTHGAPTLYNPNESQTRRHIRAATSLLSSRHLMGSIYERGFSSAGRTVSFRDVAEISKRLSTFRFSAPNTICMMRKNLLPPASSSYPSPVRLNMVKNYMVQEDRKLKSNNTLASSVAPCSSSPAVNNHDYNSSRNGASRGSRLLAAKLRHHKRQQEQAAGEARSRRREEGVSSKGLRGSEEKEEGLDSCELRSLSGHSMFHSRAWTAPPPSMGGGKIEQVLLHHHGKGRRREEGKEIGEEGRGGGEVGSWQEKYRDFLSINRFSDKLEVACQGKTGW